MTVSENKKLVQGLFEESGSFVDALADDVRWTVMGTTVFSDTYRGKQDVLERLFGPLMEQLVSPGRLTVQNLVAEGDYVVVQAQASDRITKTGQPYNNTYCMVMKIVDGKVSELDEYADTELVTSAFGPRK
jgi:uncharacterized protein